MRRRRRGGGELGSEGVGVREDEWVGTGRGSSCTIMRMCTTTTHSCHVLAHVNINTAKVVLTTSSQPQFQKVQSCK